MSLGGERYYLWKLVNVTVNPITPTSDQCQMSPAALPELLHHTVWRSWLSVAYYRKMKYDYTTKSRHLPWENVLFELSLCTLFMVSICVNLYSKWWQEGGNVFSQVVQKWGPNRNLARVSVGMTVTFCILAATAPWAPGTTAPWVPCTTAPEWPTTSPVATSMMATPTHPSKGPWAPWSTGRGRGRVGKGGIWLGRELEASPHASARHSNAQHLVVIVQAFGFTGATQIKVGADCALETDSNQGFFTAITCHVRVDLWFTLLGWKAEGNSGISTIFLLSI